VEMHACRVVLPAWLVVAGVLFPFLAPHSQPREPDQAPTSRKSVGAIKARACCLRSGRRSHSRSDAEVRERTAACPLSWPFLFTAWVLWFVPTRRCQVAGLEATLCAPSRPQGSLPSRMLRGRADKYGTLGGTNWIQ